MKHVLYAFALVAFLYAGIASPAAAAKMEFPNGAPVGFSFDLPDGWTTRNLGDRGLEVSGDGLSILITPWPDSATRSSNGDDSNK